MQKKTSEVTISSGSVVETTNLYEMDREIRNMIRKEQEQQVIEERKRYKKNTIISIISLIFSSLLVIKELIEFFL